MLALLLASTLFSQQDPHAALELGDLSEAIMTGRNLDPEAKRLSFRIEQGREQIRAVEIMATRRASGYDASAARLRIEIKSAAGATLHTETFQYTRFRPGRLIRTDSFESGRFGWARLELKADVEVKGTFELVVTPDAKAPGALAFGTGQHWSRWLIRPIPAADAEERDEPAFYTPPAPDSALYLADFESMAETIEKHYPAFEKKKLNWPALKTSFRKRFATATTHHQHIANAYAFIAALKDAHSAITHLNVSFDMPAFDGLNGAGLWIATDRGKLIVHSLAPDHPLGDRLPPGAELLSVAGRPARQVLIDQRSKLQIWQGWSTNHLLDARLSTTFFPFDGRKRLRAKFLLANGETTTLQLIPQPAPSRVTQTTGDRESRGLVRAKMIRGEIGYIRILGAMGAPTEAAFHRAFDGLRAARGIILDCRGMGGGSTRVAWSIAGRFHQKAVEPAGTFGKMKPTGPWQFGGPVVMLQDEIELSAAEGFTMGMTEEKRVISVGRPTAGVTMMPQRFHTPSTLFSYRVSRYDVHTWRTKYSPEGIGMKPDVPVPYTASLLGRLVDPCFEVGLSVLRAQLSGETRDAVIAEFAALLAPQKNEAPKVRLSSSDALTTYLQSDHVRAWLGEEMRSALCRQKSATTAKEAIPRIESLLRLARALGLDEAILETERSLNELRAR